MTTPRSELDLDLDYVALTAPTDPERARKLLDRLHLAELTPAQERRLDEIRREYFDGATSDERRGQLFREQRALTVGPDEPDYLAIIAETGTIAASEAPAAGSPQRRQAVPPSAPVPASEEEIDAMYAALRPEHAHHFQREQEGEAVELAEAAGERPFTDSELGLAAGLRARYGLAELTPRERAACAEIDRRRADEDYRRELHEARRRAADNARELAEITPKVAPQTKRRDRAAGVVLPKSK